MRSSRRSTSSIADQGEDEIGSFASPTDLNGNGGYILLRSSIPPEQVENTLLATVRSLDPLLPLTQVQTMEQAVSVWAGPRQLLNCCGRFYSE
jgi:hypothetical protein